MSYAYVCALAGNIVSFSVGTSLTWSSPLSLSLQNSNETILEKVLSAEEVSWISALLPLGSAFGPFIYGYLTDKIGRKNTLLGCGVPFLVCYIMLAFAKISALYYVARFIIGLAVGGVFTVMPMYMAEIAEDSNRGALGSVMNCFLCSGILFSYSLGPYVPVWVFNLVLAIFPGIFLVLFFFLAPESPHYHVNKNEHELAKSVLRKIRSGEDKDIERELSEIQTKIRDEGKATFLDIFKSKGLIKAYIISVCLVAFQQLSGINAVLFYAESIFTDAGTSLQPEVCSIIIGCVQFGTSFVTPLLADRLGRRILLIFSSIGVVVSGVPLGVYSYLKDQGKDVSSISFLPILCLVVYILTYNSGLGPLPWAVMGELFPSNIKSVASSTTASICWVFGFLIAKYFDSVSDAIGMGPSFWVFAAFCAVAAVFCLLYMVETKGKSLKEIQDALSS